MRRFVLIFMACMMMLTTCLQIGFCKNYGSIKTSPQIKKYILKVPKSYKDGEPNLPLIVYLGVTFKNYSKLQSETKVFVDHQSKDSFIFFAPLLEMSRPSNLQALKTMLDQVIEKYPVDTTRIYLIGTGLGGYTGWGLAVQNPDLFATFLSVEGGPPGPWWDEDILNNVGVLKNLPIRIYHCVLDELICFERVQEIVNALKAAGGDPTLIAVPGKELHQYSDEDFDWLFQNQKR